MLNIEQTKNLEQAIMLLLQLRNEQSIENWEVQREQNFIKQCNGYKVTGVPKKSILEELKELLITLKIKASVRQRTNGLYEVRNSAFGSVYGRTVAELEEKLTKLIKGTAEKKKALLLSEYYQETYLPFKKNELAPSSISDIEINFAYIIKNGFDMPLNRYTAESIEKFLLEIPQTRKRKKVRGILNNIFTHAKRLKIVKNNPCNDVAPVKHVSETGKALSFKKQKSFFTELFASPKVTTERKLYYVFVYLTGTRRGEALGETVSDVDFTENILHITGTKTENSNRYLPLFPLVKKLLERVQPKNGQYFPFTTGQVNNFLHTLLTDNRLHDLRHTFGTIAMCVQKLDPKTVALYMGHSDPTTTLKIYTHPEQLDRALFFNGSLSDEEKTAKLRQEYNEILDIIDEFLNSIPKTYPKNQ